MAAIKLALASNDFIKSNGLSPDDHSTKFEGPSMTRSEYGPECDINTIMAQYDKYLSDPMMSLRAASAYYIDLDSVPQTLMESMEILNAGREAFYRLPAVVRKEFDNDPVAFVDYAMDPANIDVMREWGLAPPPEAKKPPLEVKVVGEPAAPASSSAPIQGAPSTVST